MREAFIVDGIRTPIGKIGGSLSSVRADDLAALVIKEIVQRNPSIPPSDIEDVILGCANQAGEDNRNVARMALLLAGLPTCVGGETINRLCASGMAAVINAANAIKAGNGEIYIAGGVEHMTRAPYVISKASSPYGRDQKLYDSSFGWRFINPRMQEMYGTESMGETAENLVEQYSISREDQDYFAYQSQMKARTAWEKGRLTEEIVKVPIPQPKGADILFDKDEFMKPDTTIEKLATLKPAFRKNGTVTAGNSSGLNDGAAALLVASDEALKKYNLSPWARIVSAAIAGVEPRVMGIGPVYASEKVMKRAGLSLKDIDIIEINEAFAAQVLACLKEMHIDKEDPRVNPNGGAIALGHPLGMSGARILQTAAIELNKKRKKYALVTMCIGVGQGYAVILENCNL